MKEGRIFDIVSRRAALDGNSVLLAAKEMGAWRTYTAREVWETACRLSHGLLALGIDNTDLRPEAQEKIAILSPNRPEWIIADIAVQLTGAVLTPIYPTIAPSELAFILTEAGVSKVFIADEQIYERYGAVLKSIPAIKHIIAFDEVSGTTYWRGVLAQHIAPDERILERIIPETLATIIYTSGTTGDPKGVMLSHRNIVHNVYDSMPQFTFAEPGEKALSFLPLNHIFERTLTYIYTEGGISIYYAESMETIGDNLKEVQPMVFTTVPRLLEKVYEKILTKGLELKGIKRGLFFWALKLGKRYDNVHKGSLWYRFQLWLANRLVFSKWRAALGGKVQAIVTGSAACQERLIRIFTAAGIIIMEGYGLTETSPVISVNTFASEGRRIGSIGPLIDNVEAQIAADGEILVRGANIMMGYYKRPELTAEVLKDGWFHTGDIGQWVEQRFLKITDRKKEIFKTSGGKYVAPQPIENKMKESPFIEQIMVVGAGKKFTGALIVPAFSTLRKALQDEHQGIQLPSNNEALIAMPQSYVLIRRQLDKYNPLFGHIEQIKRFALLSREWTVDGGELTPSLKIRRKVIMDKYATALEEIYGEEEV